MPFEAVGSTSCGLLPAKYAPFLDKLAMIYEDMDHDYKTASGYYGFTCSGCNDNCCYTRFYHHTFLEYLYILKGYNGLGHDKKSEVKDRALEVAGKTVEADKKGSPVRLMCPLNFDGLCILYDFRPMICRLHGIQYELLKPGQSVTYSPGCEAFMTQCKSKDYFTFDRTRFYIRMSKLERELRQAIGARQKIKLTIAQMLT